MLWSFLLILWTIISLTSCLEPVTVAISTVVGAAATSQALFCRVQECCNTEKDKWFYSQWIYADDVHLQDLQSDLNHKLHGQHLASEILYKSISSHLKNPNPSKPLVLSLHGFGGIGKTYVSRLIVKNLYLLGEESQYVHRINFQQEFYNPNKIFEYRDKIVEYIKSRKLEKCGRQLFILDDVDKSPPNIMDAFLPFFDFSSEVEANKAIFIVISNKGAHAINSITLDFFKAGKRREDISLKHIEEVVNLSAFNELGGLQKSHVISKSLIDFYVPFLPLERHHVKRCIVDYLKKRYNVEKTIDDDFVSKVSEELLYLPPDLKVFSKKGCKNVEKRVDILL